MKINKYYPLALLYFFFNSVGLPFGMLYTMFLTPVFYVWMRIKGNKWILLKFFLFAIPFILVHYNNGVDEYYFARSIVLYLATYIFCYAFYTWVKSYSGLDKIFRKIIIINFFFTLIALIILMTPLRPLLWGDWSISVGGLSVENWPRLAMLTYEPSYYSTLLVPLFAFYTLRYALVKGKNSDFTLLFMAGVPLILSFSMGVIAGLILAGFIVFTINAHRVLTSKRLLYAFIATVVVIFLTTAILSTFYPNNPLFVRIDAVLAGQDQSANGRTYEALQLGHTIAKLKDVWWGVGAGQLKIIGAEVIKTYYNYPPDYGQVSLPSAMGETLALFGYVGIFLRIFIQLWLFFKTRVMNNYYQSYLFFFMFIYQFTGSFTTNIAEYVIWILAFTNVFSVFNKEPRKRIKSITVAPAMAA